MKSICFVFKTLSLSHHLLRNMPKKLCLREKRVRPDTLTKVGNHIQHWLQLLYFRRPGLFTWNAYTEGKKCQHSFPPVLVIGQLVSRRRQLFFRCGLLTPVSVLLPISIIFQRFVLFWNLGSLFRTEFSLTWHIMSISSQSRALWQHFSEQLSKLCRHTLRHGSSLPPTAACSNLEQLIFPIILLWSTWRNLW